MEQNKILEIILVKMDDMKASQEEMLARMDADKAEAKREREADKAESKAERKADKEEMMARMDAKMDYNQEKTEMAINSIRSELEGEINAWMEYAVAVADKQTPALREELNQKVEEAERRVQASINTRTENFQGDMTGVKTNLREVVANTRYLQTELDNRAQGLEVRIAEVEAWVELGVSGRTGNDSGRAKPPKFDGSTSWAMF
jgi:hypothetical protein